MKKPVTIQLPEEMWAEIDKAAKSSGMARQVYIETALLEKFNRDGDESSTKGPRCPKCGFITIPCNTGYFTMERESVHCPGCKTEFLCTSFDVTKWVSEVRE